ncbi:hypothetical protein N431DRAFT_333880 [Stipitochalara longipes BDJ]|nr:hypothetical protein N431DRAFT_333880 [Stipitochalara longipes BDJ]
MADATPNSKSTLFSKLAKSDKKSPHGGRAVPVQFVICCGTEAQVHGYLELDNDKKDGFEAPLGCRRSSHATDILLSTTCLMRLPLSKEDQLLQLRREAIRIFNDRESDLQRVIDVGKFADHELAIIDLGVVWHSIDLPCTWFGGAYVEDVEEFAEDNEKSEAEASEFDESREMDQKRDLEVEKALDALAATDWRGHLIAACYMEGPPITREGSVAEEDGNNPLWGPSDLETPD